MKKILGVDRRTFLTATSAASATLVLSHQAQAQQAQATAKSTTPNPVQVENSKPGTPHWELTNPADKNEIVGYASQTSVAHNNSVDFFIDTPDSSVTINIYRLGWYGGAGAREMQAEVVVPGLQQKPFTVDPSTQMVECDWISSYRLNIGNASTWVSGVYVAKLTANTSKKQSFIHFVVRDDWRQADHLFQCSVTTYQAYNNWGGKSLYNFNSTNGVASPKVSFNRPYLAGQGAGQFFSYEYPMLRFVEREGYDVVYCTNIDTHQNPMQLLLRKHFMSVGHDEYWSWEMRDNVELGQGFGVNLSFFSANTCYWQVRLEPSPINGGGDRTLVCYKNAETDPYSQQRRLSQLTTVSWRQAPVNRPENALIGVMFEAYPVENQDIVVTNSSHWIFNDTGLTNGSKLRFLLGYEVDRIFPGSPKGLITLATSPIPKFDLPSNMTIYRARSGAQVFAAGTIQWSLGLDDYNRAQNGIPAWPAAQQITRNILNAFAA